MLHHQRKRSLCLRELNNVSTTRSDEAVQFQVQRSTRCEASFTGKVKLEEECDEKQPVSESIRFN